MCSGAEQSRSLWHWSGFWCTMLPLLSSCTSPFRGPNILYVSLHWILWPVLQMCAVVALLRLAFNTSFLCSTIQIFAVFLCLQLTLSHTHKKHSTPHISILLGMLGYRCEWGGFSGLRRTWRQSCNSRGGIPGKSPYLVFWCRTASASSVQRLLCVWRGICVSCWVPRLWLHVRIHWPRTHLRGGAVPWWNHLLRTHVLPSSWGKRQHWFWLVGGGGTKSGGISLCGSSCNIQWWWGCLHSSEPARPRRFSSLVSITLCTQAVQMVQESIQLCSPMWPDVEGVVHIPKPELWFCVCCL